MEVTNAIIQSTSLGNMDRGLSFLITLKFDGYVQGYGGYDLVNHLNKPSIDVSSLFLSLNELFPYVLWEKLPGKACRVYRNSLNILALGNLLEDKWLYLKREKDNFVFVVTTLEEMEKYLY